MDPDATSAAESVAWLGSGKDEAASCPLSPYAALELTYLSEIHTAL